MAWGSLIKGPLQTANEHLIKFLHKLMRHNVYAFREIIGEATKTENQ